MDLTEDLLNVKPIPTLRDCEDFTSMSKRYSLPYIGQLLFDAIKSTNWLSLQNENLAYVGSSVAMSLAISDCTKLQSTIKDNELAAWKNVKQDISCGTMIYSPKATKTI